MGRPVEGKIDFNGMINRLRRQQRQRIEAVIDEHDTLQEAARAQFPEVPDEVWAPVDWEQVNPVASWPEFYTVNDHWEKCNPAQCKGVQKLGAGGMVLGDACQRVLLDADGRQYKEICDIQQRLAQKSKVDKLLGESQLPKRFQKRTLDNFQDRDKKVLAKALKVARQFVHRYDADNGTPGLVLLGPAGTGKTHLAAGITMELLAKGVGVRYYTAPDVLATLRNAIDSGETEKVMQGLQNADLLVMDDVGKEYMPEDAGGGYTSLSWAHQEFYRMVNRRYEEERPLIVTSNLNEEQLERRYGPHLVSRLHEMCRWLVINVNDYRRGENNAGA